jgi:hypothetical protein
MGTSLARRALPRVQIADGTLQALKWLAVALMVIDHVNKYLLDWSVPAMFAAGRLAMPIFALCLAYNLARPGTLASGAYGRTMRRLAIGAAIATLPFIGLGKLLLASWWPLNILATLLVATAVMYLLEAGGGRRRSLAAAVFIVGGGLVEFWWPAIALAAAAHAYFRAPSWSALAVVTASTVALSLINGNWWAFAGVALVLVATRVQLRVPRLQRCFYVVYPAHLAALWIAQRFL